MMPWASATSRGRKLGSRVVVVVEDEVGVEVAVILILTLRHDEAPRDVGASSWPRALEAERQAGAAAVLLRHRTDALSLASGGCIEGCKRPWASTQHEGCFALHRWRRVRAQPGLHDVQARGRWPAIWQRAVA